MKRVTGATLLLVVSILLIGPKALAQEQGMGCCNDDHCFDMATLETLEGSVYRVDYITPTRGRMQDAGPGLHLVVGEGADTTTVALGPAWYLGQQGPGFEKGEQVTILGSRVTMDGDPVVIAKELTRGEEKLVLRDDQGLPAWRGQQPAGQEMQGRGMQGQGMQGRGMKGRGMQKRQGMQDGEGMQGGCKMHRRGMSEQ